MYEVFYSLRAEPFRLSPDHRFCYEHSGYAKARAYMAYALKRAEGFVMITGRPGTGKTTLIGELVEELSDEDVITANLVCTQLQADDLLRTVAYSFEVGASNIDKAELLQRITVMLNRWHREGRRALLVVDEAQDLSISAMEELRLLTNIQVGGQPLLQIFLLGQPELRDLILSPEMEQVHQRIVAASHLEGLQEDEAEAYVLHRLQVVGWQGDPAIDRRIFPLIHKFSEGIPRRINLICSRLFLLGCVEERHEIGPDDVRVVIQELQAESLAAGSWHTEQEFADTGEPDWLTGPATVPDPVGSEAGPVQLHAVGNASFTPEEITAAEQDEAAKKKEPPPVVSLSPAADTELEPASIPILAPAIDFEPKPLHQETPAFVSPAEKASNSGSQKTAPDPGSFGRNPAPETLADTSNSAAELPLTPGARFTEDERIDSAQSRLADYQLPTDGQSAATPARVTDSRELGRASVPRRRFSRLLIVLAILLALGISLLFFLELYVGREDDWENRGGELPAAMIPEPAEEAEPPLPDIEQLPSEKWEEDGELIFWEETVSTQESAQKLEALPAEGAAEEDLQALESGLVPVDAASSEGVVDDAASSDLIVTNSTATNLTATDAANADITSVGASSVDVTGIVESTALEPAQEQGIGAALESSPTQIAVATTYSVNFAFDSIFLDKKARVILAELVGRMQQQAQIRAIITGFADYQGDQSYNLVLSRQRGEAVMRYLVEAGVSGGRLEVDGRGAQQQPVNGQAQIAKQLRVVEINLVGEIAPK